MSSQLKMEDKNILEHYSDLSVGDVLLRARKSYGLSLQQAAQQTLIRSDLIEALENEDKEKLPSRVYTIGFVKTYAEFLGLDAHKIVYLYKIQVIGEDENDNKKPSGKKVKSTSKSSGSLPAIILLGSGGLLIVSAIIFVIYTITASILSTEPEESKTALSGHNVESLAAMMEENNNSPLAMASDAELSKWKALEIPAPTDTMGLVMPEIGSKAYGNAFYKDGLVLKATRTVWVKISSSEGELLLNTVLKQGDVVHISAEDMLSVETLYAEALDIYVEGEYQGFLRGKENEKRELILSKQNVSDHLAPHSDKKLADE